MKRILTELRGADQGWGEGEIRKDWNCRPTNWFWNFGNPISRLEKMSNPLMAEGNPPPEAITFNNHTRSAQTEMGHASILSRSSREHKSVNVNRR